MEAGLGVIYTAIEHVELDGRMGLFLPGTYYQNYSDDDFADGFDRPAVGAQLTTRIKF